jgi:DNA-binding IclR family transcriptional regulator
MATKVQESSDESERKYRAPALEKGLDILELLAAEGEPLTTSQMAQKLGRSVSELFRMVLTLEARGYIAPIGEREGYGLSNKMFSLGVAQTPTRNLIEIALPEMKKLSELSGQSCHLVVASNEQIVVVARIESSRDVGFSVRVGYRRPIIESTSGVVLVGNMKEAEREQLIKQLEQAGSESEMSMFLKRLELVSKQEYVTIPSDFVEGVMDISAPIFASKGVVAALTVPYVRCRPEVCNDKKALELLLDTVRKISNTLQTEAR